MRTDLNLAEPFTLAEATVSDADLLGFDRPRDIVRDPLLTLGRKRQLLAYWASDVHAVAGSPALRTYAFGPTVSIDDILEALRALDEMIDLPAIAAHDGSTAMA
jgi:hypothetical protein